MSLSATVPARVLRRQASRLPPSAGDPRHPLDQCRGDDDSDPQRAADLQRASGLVSGQGFEFRPPAARHRRDWGQAGSRAMSKPSASASTPPACSACPTSMASRRSAAFPPGSRCRRIRIWRPGGAGTSCSPGSSSPMASSICSSACLRPIAAPAGSRRGGELRPIGASLREHLTAAFPQGRGGDALQRDSEAHLSRRRAGPAAAANSRGPRHVAGLRRHRALAARSFRRPAERAHGAFHHRDAAGAVRRSSISSWWFCPARSTICAA